MKQQMLEREVTELKREITTVRTQLFEANREITRLLAINNNLNHNLVDATTTRHELQKVIDGLLSELRDADTRPD